MHYRSLTTIFHAHHIEFIYEHMPIPLLSS